MKKLLVFGISFFALFALIACEEVTTTNTTAAATTTTTTAEVCDVDANGICVYNDGSIEWEEDLSGNKLVVQVGVDVAGLAPAIEAAWNAAYPAMTGLVDAIVYEASDSESSGVTGIVTLQGAAPDIAIIIGSGSVGREVNFLDLSSYMEDVIANDVLQSGLAAVNSGDVVHYLPGVYDGMAFAWNKTMFEYFISTEQLDIVLTDTNGDNLPDAFDTWEEIFAIADALTERLEFVYRMDGAEADTVQTIYEIYPLCLGQEWSNYSAYSAGGFSLFPDNNPLQPGFDTDEFLAGLAFMADFSTHAMSFQTDGTTKLLAASMGWRWDNFLHNQYPFGLVGTWMDVETNENTYNADFVFSPMPTYDGVQLSPIVKTKGFVVNIYSDCPGAAVTVLQFIYSQAGMTTISDNSSYLLALEAESALIPTTLNENKLQFGFALGFGFNEPAIALPNNPSVLAVNVLYNSGITAAQSAVYDGSMTPLAAQTAIVAAAATWIADNNVAE